MSISQQTQSKDTVIHLLNSLLRGEISAAEVYKQAAAGVKHEPAGAELRQIEKQHGHAIERLAAHIRDLGGEPSTDAGVWGVWAKTVQGTARLLGPTSAMQALQAGEVHGLDEYHRALNSGMLPTDLEAEIQNKLIPQQQTHIETLGRLATSQ